MRHTLWIAIGVVWALGCHDRAFQLEPDKLMALARGESVANDRGEVLGPKEVESIQLRIQTKRTCTLGERMSNMCDEQFMGDLRDVEVRGRRLRLVVPTSIAPPMSRIVEIEPHEVESVLVRYVQNRERPEWRPFWGVGFSAGGTGLAGVHLQWMPIEAIALEGTVLPAAGLFAGSIGGRLRPVELFGFVRPFLGASYGGMAAAGPGRDGVPSRATSTRAAARAGIDMEIFWKQGYLGLEYNYMYELGGENTPETGWRNWGGVTFGMLL